MKNKQAHLANSPRDWNKLIFTLAIPIILSNVSVPLVGMVDTAVMGRMSEPKFMGATAIGAIIFSSVFWLFGFLRMGTGGLVAQAYGAIGANGTSSQTIATPVIVTPGTPAKAAYTEVEYAIVRALLSALLVGGLLVLFRAPIIELALRAFTTSAEIKGLVADYCEIRMFAAPATLMLYAVLGAFIGLQETRAVLALQLVLNLVNIVLTIVFFKVFDWEIKGVALATLIAEYVALIFGLAILQRKTQLLPARASWSAITNINAMRQLIEVNGNLFVRTLCLTFAFYWLTQSGSRLGEVTLAANAVLIHMLHFMAYALDGFSHAAETLCGYAYGQRNKTMFKSAARAATLGGVCFALIFVAGYWFFGESIVALMTTLPQIREYAVQWIPLIAITPILSVWSFLLDGIYIGTTHTRDMRNGMIQSLIVFMIANVILIHYFGNTGLWISYIVLMLARTATLYRTYPRILAKLA